MELQTHMERVEHICCLMEHDQDYFTELTQYLPSLNQAIWDIMVQAEDASTLFTINKEYVLQVLKDIVSGVENKDTVLLLDVLRYGLCEIFEYTEKELRIEE